MATYQPSSPAEDAPLHQDQWLASYACSIHNPGIFDVKASKLYQLRTALSGYVGAMPHFAPPIEYIVPDEMDEATPQSLRPLKRILDAKVRRKAEKAAMCLGRLRNF